MMMAKGWTLKLIRPADSIKMAVQVGWSKVLKDLESWMEKDLVHALVYGGMGLQGISETAFYQWVSSPEGLSQLGIEESEPPKLLRAYENTIKISRTNNFIRIKFGNLATLKAATPHPASGTGFLQIESWLEWVFDGLKVNSGFVPRAKLPKRAQRAIRINTAPGGLMLPKGKYGSKGAWHFPKRYEGFEKRWLKNNIDKVQKLIQKRSTSLLTKHMS